MMKSILLWIKIIIIVGMVGIVACSGSPLKNNSAMLRNNLAMEKSKVASDAQARLSPSPLLKKDYEQALAYMKQGQYDSADKLLRVIIDKDPSLAGPYINLGIIRLNEGALEESEKWFVQAKARGSRNPGVENYLGIIYRQQGRFKEAELAYKKAIQINPMYAQAYLNLGVLYDLYLPNYSAALSNYKQYQVFNPDDKQVETWIIDLGQRMQASN